MNKDNQKMEVERMENELFRVTSLKANGSVWTKTYEEVEKLNEVLPVIENYPHVVISRQVLQSPTLNI